MTASEDAKKAGLKNLAEVSEMTKTSPQTLINWYNNKPELFEMVVLGCATRKVVSLHKRLDTGVGIR